MKTNNLWHAYPDCRSVTEVSAEVRELPGRHPELQIDNRGLQRVGVNHGRLAQFDEILVDLVYIEARYDAIVTWRKAVESKVSICIRQRLHRTAQRAARRFGHRPEKYRRAERGLPVRRHLAGNLAGLIGDRDLDPRGSRVDEYFEPIGRVLHAPVSPRRTPLSHD